MNMTYARAKFRFTPEVKDKLLAKDWPDHPSRALLAEREMVVSKTASTLAPERKTPGRRAHRHRLNPLRRTVEQNRAAR